MVGSEWPTFQIAGVVVEKCELTSKKNPGWRGCLVKIALLGGTFDCWSPEDVFLSVSEGQEVRGEGFLRLVYGKPGLNLTKLFPVDKAGQSGY